MSVSLTTGPKLKPQHPLSICTPSKAIPDSLSDLRTEHPSPCPHWLWTAEESVLMRRNNAKAKAAPEALAALRPEETQGEVPSSGTRLPCTIDHRPPGHQWRSAPPGTGTRVQLPEGSEGVTRDRKTSSCGHSPSAPPRGSTARPRVVVFLRPQNG